MSLTHKKVVLVVSGGIAAYKAAVIAGRLRKAGAEVKCIMTAHAAEFITPLTLREISGNPVALSMFDDVSEFRVEHIALAQWADIFVVAPATANIIGKIAGGIADDLATTAVMATTAPVLLAPAMNTNMFDNPIVQENLAKLRAHGYLIMDPDAGMLACGTCGTGRLPEPERIVEYIEHVTGRTELLKNLKVIVTAGGTREALDPVRYIGNHSSGRMGFAIAKSAAAAGANVTLVAAPTDLPTPCAVTRVDVTTTGEMKEAVDSLYDDCHIVIKAAAVADYRPEHKATQKIKKTGGDLTLHMVKNPDILYELGRRKAGQVLVGFAAETENVTAYGQAKLKKKNLDMLIANDVTAQGAGFKGSTNIATFLYPDGTTEPLKIMTKDELAKEIIARVARIYKEKTSQK